MNALKRSATSRGSPRSLAHLSSLLSALHFYSSQKDIADISIYLVQTSSYIFQYFSKMHATLIKKKEH